MLKFWYDVCMLGWEAQQVIWLRSIKLAMGGKVGEREAARMISEKMAAATEAGLSLATGSGLPMVIGGYRSKVRANRRRLSR